MDVFRRQRQVIGERPVLAEDAEHPSTWAVVFKPPLAIRARPAADVYLARNPFAYKGLVLPAFLDHAGELVAENALEPHVAPCDLKVRSADTSKAYLYKGLSPSGLWFRMVAPVNR